jgi:hypothetical protein
MFYEKISLILQFKFTLLDTAGLMNTLTGLGAELHDGGGVEVDVEDGDVVLIGVVVAVEGREDVFHQKCSLQCSLPRFHVGSEGRNSAIS